MGEHLVMSEKERESAKVLARVKAKMLKLKEAAAILRVSYRQVRRRYKKYQAQGDKGLTHGLRGKQSNHCYEEEIKQAAIKRYKERYDDFGPTLAAEKLAEEGIQVNHETLRRWLLGAGLWSRRRKSVTHRSRRERRAHFGELVQMDGSHHRWFEERGEQCCLMNMVDDATSRTLSLFAEEETSAAAMRLLWDWIEKYGIPAALYTDCKNVYVVDERAKQRAEEEGREALTQFGRACAKLGIRIITAHSPQAKGRVERNHGVYQDRLVKELRLRGISQIEPANELLRGGFVDQLNERFAVKAREEADYHRSTSGYDLAAIFCHEEERSLSADWMVRFENHYYQLERQSQRAPIKGKVAVRKYLDGTLHFSYRGQELSYEDLGKCRPPKEQTNSVKAAAEKKAAISPKQKYVPPADHPWRKFQFGRKTTEQKAPRGSG